jgi:hypothetical protein
MVRPQPDTVSPPPASPQSIEELPPRVRRDGWFTAVFVPVGAAAAVIVLFGLWTTEILVLPGYTGQLAKDDVVFAEVKLGSTNDVHRHIWAIGFLLSFLGIGGAIGLLIGKGMGRLSRWGTSS